tara:strand:- start:269 stop:385 length:117 start_codon:yes stop_codon:yes gene_type:complete
MIVSFSINYSLVGFEIARLLVFADEGYGILVPCERVLQ